VTSGDASDVVTATGRFGTAPTVDFPTPVITKKLERTELIAGTGPTLAAGDVVVLQYTLLDGATGKVVAASDYTTAGKLATLGDTVPTAVTTGLECATVGSRVAIATDAEGAGQDPSQTTDSFVFVVDILKAFSGKAYGVPQIPQAGMPSIVTAPSGAPGITVPKEDPPTALQVNVLREAQGEVVKAGDHVVVKYTAALWSDSSVFDSTWRDGPAKILTLTASDSVPKGLVTGLVGRHVGSQVLIVIPPDEGYGANGSNGVPSGSTLVYVVDLLGLVG
jgi:peptidylprolyl isomerase